jgi:Zn-dependent protease with chaperone function
VPGIESALAALAAPDRLTLAVLALIAAVALLVLWRRQRNPWLLIGHLGLLFTAGILLAISLSCALGAVTGFIAFCSMLITKLLLYVVPPAFLLALAGGTWLIPAFYRRRHDARPLRLPLLARLCRALGIRPPRCYSLDTAEPLAFTAGNAIHLSTGLTELLTAKELEAVLLHELHHVRHRHSFLKLSAILSRAFSPIAAFAPITAVLAGEERSADDFAAGRQGTHRHLLAAKRKLQAHAAYAANH